MPEIAEVYRAADYIRQHLVGRTLAIVKAQHDENVFGKVGTSGAEIENALTGKKIVGAGQQGKYFWISMATPPHLLCHFGMAGWFHIRNIPTFYYKDTKKDKAADKEWPPKYWKFTFETKPEGKDKKVLEAAFVDFRRFARVRLINCAIEEIRNLSPLKENGPDPNTDKAIVTRDWLAALCQRKHAPIKAVLLDQANISGIGNWVGDEVLFQARIHPEQYAHTLSEDQIIELHKQMMEVVRIAIETKSDSDEFPDTWLFKHRWGKGRKANHELPNGEKITFLTVGGRTSAIVPTLQKKTGPVAGEVNGKDKAGASKTNGTKTKGKRKKVEEREEESDEEKDMKSEDDIETAVKTKRPKRGRATKSETIDTSTQPIEIEFEPQSPYNKRTKDGKLWIEQLDPTAPAEEVAAVTPAQKPSRNSRKPASKNTVKPAEKSSAARDNEQDSSTKRARTAKSIPEKKVVDYPIKKEPGRRRSARIAKE